MEKAPPIKHFHDKKVTELKSELNEVKHIGEKIRESGLMLQDEVTTIQGFGKERRKELFEKTAAKLTPVV